MIGSKMRLWESLLDFPETWLLQRSDTCWICLPETPGGKYVMSVSNTILALIKVTRCTHNPLHTLLHSPCRPHDRNPTATHWCLEGVATLKATYRCLEDYRYYYNYYPLIVNIIISITVGIPYTWSGLYFLASHLIR